MNVEIQKLCVAVCASIFSIQKAIAYQLEGREEGNQAREKEKKKNVFY